MIELIQTKRTEGRLLSCMSVHYSQPRGFVGRNIPYAVLFDGVYYGHIIGGSATLHLPGRNEYFNINKSNLGNIVNNIFYHIEKINGQYPVRNFSQLVLKTYMKQIQIDWEERYSDKVIGHESLVELPRTGELYTRSGWILVGQTKGYTCKRTAGIGTDSWSGKRVWNTSELRPKLVFCSKPI